MLRWEAVTLFMKAPRDSLWCSGRKAIRGVLSGTPKGAAPRRDRPPPVDRKGGCSCFPRYGDISATVQRVKDIKVLLGKQKKSVQKTELKITFIPGRRGMGTAFRSSGYGPRRPGEAAGLTVCAEENGCPPGGPLLGILWISIKSLERLKHEWKYYHTSIQLINVNHLIVKCLVVNHLRYYICTSIIWSKTTTLETNITWTKITTILYCN